MLNSELTSSGYDQISVVFLTNSKQKKTNQIQHNLTQQHILQRPQRPRLTLRTQILKRLEEVRVGGGVIFVFGVEDA